MLTRNGVDVRAANCWIVLETSGLHAQGERACIFLVFAHEQILHSSSAPDRQKEQASCDRVECPAMAYLLNLDLSPHERHGIMRSHPFRFVHEQDTVKTGT